MWSSRKSNPHHFNQRQESVNRLLMMLISADSRMPLQRIDQMPLDGNPSELTSVLPESSHRLLKGKDQAWCGFSTCHQYKRKQSTQAQSAKDYPFQKKLQRPELK